MVCYRLLIFKKLIIKKHIFCCLCKPKNFDKKSKCWGVNAVREKYPLRKITCKNIIIAPEYFYKNVCKEKLFAKCKTLRNQGENLEKFKKRPYKAKKPE